MRITIKNLLGVEVLISSIAEPAESIRENCWFIK